MFSANKISREQIELLFKDLHSVESGRFTKVELTPVGNRWEFDVKLTPMHVAGKGILEASMFSGYLSQRGWDKVFTRTES